MRNNCEKTFTAVYKNKKEEFKFFSNKFCRRQDYIILWTNLVRDNWYEIMTPDEAEKLGKVGNIIKLDYYWHQNIHIPHKTDSLYELNR